MKDPDDFREEIEFHVDMRAELNREAGLAGDTGARIGPPPIWKLHLNSGGDAPHAHQYFFRESLQDLRYAARGFARQPLFTLTAVFAAALGIGSTTAVFSVVDRILFRSLPYAHDERLVSLGMMAPLDTNEFLFADAYFDWRKHQTPFTSITSFTAGVRGLRSHRNQSHAVGLRAGGGKFPADIRYFAGPRDEISRRKRTCRMVPAWR